MRYYPKDYYRNWAMNYLSIVAKYKSKRALRGNAKKLSYC